MLALIIGAQREQLDRFMREKDMLCHLLFPNHPLRIIKIGQFPRPVLISPGRVGWRERAINPSQKNPGKWRSTDAM